MFSWMTLAAAASLPVFLAVSGVVRRRRDAARAWGETTPAALALAFAQVERLSAVDRAVARDLWRAVRDAQGRERRRLALVLCDHLVDATPSRVERLRAIGLYIRLSQAVAPVDPLPWRSIRTGPVRALLGLGRVFHALLVTAGEQLRVRAEVLAWAFCLLARSLRITRGLIAARGPNRYARLGRERGDWGRLDRAHVETVRTLVRSVDGEQG